MSEFLSVISRTNTYPFSTFLASLRLYFPKQFLLAPHRVHHTHLLQGRLCTRHGQHQAPWLRDLPWLCQIPLTKQGKWQNERIQDFPQRWLPNVSCMRKNTRDTVKSISCCDCQFSGWLQVCNLYLNLSGCSVCGNYFGGRQDKTSPCWLQQKSWQPNVIQENPQAYSGTTACGYYGRILWSAEDFLLILSTQVAKPWRWTDPPLPVSPSSMLCWVPPPFWLIL